MINFDKVVEYEGQSRSGSIVKQYKHNWFESIDRSVQINRSILPKKLRNEMGLPESPRLLKGVAKIPTKKNGNHQRMMSKDSNLSITDKKFGTL